MKGRTGNLAWIESENKNLYLQWNIGSVGCPRRVVACVLENDIIVSEFKLPPCYYIHFWTNILVKGMNSIIPSQLWVK